MRIVLIGPREEAFTEDADLEYREQMLRSYPEIAASVVAFGQDYTSSREFLGIEYLCANLRKHGHTVLVISCGNEGWSNEQALERIVEFEPDMIGISLLYDLQLFSGLTLARDAKQSCGEAFLVFGGPLASVIPGILMENFAFIDGVVKGEGEIAIVKLAEAIATDGDLRGVPGLLYRVDGSVCTNAPGPPTDLAQLPMATRDVIRSMRARELPVQSAYLTTSRGCKAFCIFCTVPNLVRGHGGSTYRFRAATSVVDEMEHVINTHGVNRFYMADDNFLGYGPESQQRLLDFADEIIRRGIKVQFHAECRVDSLVEPVLQKLRDAGFDQLLLGLESGSDRTLKRWVKGQTVAQNEAAIALAQKLKFDLIPSVILLDWESSVSEVEETVSFIERTRIYECAQPLSLVNKLKVHCGTAAGRRYENVHGAPVLRAVTDDASLRQWTEAVTYQKTPIDNPYVLQFWRALNREANRWGILVDDVLPALLIEGRRGDKARDKFAQLEFVRAIKRYRKAQGPMLVGLMRMLIDATIAREAAGEQPDCLMDLASEFVAEQESRFAPRELALQLNAGLYESSHFPNQGLARGVG